MPKRLFPYVGALVSLWLALAAYPDDRVVHVFNWTNYIDEATIPSFEAKTGIKVVYDLMDSNDVLEGKLLAGNSGYDIVVPTSNFFAEQLRAGLYLPIDRARLKNYDNLDPILMKRVAAFDPGNTYGVPYMWGNSGVAYNVAAIKARMPDAPTDSWRMIFDPTVAARFADCGIAILDAGDEVVESALIYLGRDPDSESRADLDAATAVIRAIQPYVRYFHSTQFVDDLANGEICMALGWSGDVYQAIRNARPGVEIEYFIPKEGGIVWFDIMAIPKDAPHVDAAYAWLDHILDPTVVAGISNAVWYANPNRASRPLLAPEIRDNPVIFPPPEIMERLIAVGPKNQRFVRMRNRAWAQAKAGR
jgi:putrescine transport system substrate-binding protein